jgi:hypothetical protein
MKLKEPIEISRHILQNLEYVKLKLLLSISNTTLFIVNDFTVRVENITTTKKSLFRSPKTTTQEKITLTDITLFVYNNKMEYWGTNENEEHLRWFIGYYELDKLRQNYEKYIKLPIDQLGFEIKAKHKEDESIH